jgi:hypothetical protein
MRPIESQMKEFNPFLLGGFTLPSSLGQLGLHALEIPARFFMDVRRITLTQLP